MTHFIENIYYPECIKRILQSVRYSDNIMSKKGKECKQNDMHKKKWKW
jgi:hypothetical protein